MFLARLKSRIRTPSRPSLGRFLLASCAVAFITSSIPNPHWHAHAGGHAVHEHSAFDAPDVDHHDHDHEGEEQAASDDNSTLHVHDSNHSMNAIGMVVPCPVECLPTVSLLVALAVDAPATSILIPPYRPPIV
jgi:hypothetical protein